MSEAEAGAGARALGVPSRRFGRLSWRVRPLGLGGAWLRGQREQRRSIDEGAALVIEAVERGINYLDTAAKYGDSELVIGAALARLPADRWPYVATKAGGVPREAFEYNADWMLWSCARSLERLGVERVDLLQIHEAEQAGWERIMGRGGCLEGLREARRRGWCAGIGVTGRDLGLLTRLVRTGEFDSVLTYYEYDLLTAEATRELLPAAAARDVAVVLGSPLRMGLFAPGGFSRWERQKPPITTRRPRLEALLGRSADDMAEPALAYLLAEPRASVVLQGASAPEEVADGVRTANRGAMSAELWASVRRLAEWPGEGDGGESVEA